MKELFIVNSSVDTKQFLLQERDIRLQTISKKIKKYTTDNHLSLYNIGGERMYNIANCLSRELEIPLNEWGEHSIYSQPRDSNLYELFHKSMEDLHHYEKSTVIVTVPDQQLSDLLGWWLKLPYDICNNWELVTEQIGFHVCNINKSGDRTVYKFNES